MVCQNDRHAELKLWMVRGTRSETGERFRETYGFAMVGWMCTERGTRGVKERNFRADLPVRRSLMKPELKKMQWKPAVERGDRKMVDEKVCRGGERVDGGKLCRKENGKDCSSEETKQWERPWESNHNK